MLSKTASSSSRAVGQQQASRQAAHLLALPAPVPRLPQCHGLCALARQAPAVSQCQGHSRRHRSPCVQVQAAPAAPPPPAQREQSHHDTASGLHVVDMAQLLKAAAVYQPGQGSAEGKETRSQREARAVGIMLGAACGNALGAPFQNDRHWQVTRMFPHGLHDFWSLDLNTRPVRRGQFTGDYLMLQGVARSLLAARAADSVHQSAELAMSCDPSGPRRFAPYAELALGALRSGQTPPGELPRLAAGMLLSSEALLASTSSDRHEREPYGPADNTAAGWVAPVAVAYAGAGAGALEAAVQEACRATHTHPLGVDGARVVAAAVAWCMQQPAPGPADGAVSGPEAQPQQARQLLQHLLGVARTGDMQAKLELMLDSLEQLGDVESWTQLYSSKAWHRLTTVFSQLTYHGYATLGTEAAAVALWALVTNWGRPKQAVSVAALLAGSVPITSQITGALAGALYGDAWLPASWWRDLENEPLSSSVTSQAGMSEDEEDGAVPRSIREAGGRTAAVALGKALAGLQCRSVGIPPAQWAQGVTLLQ